MQCSRPQYVPWLWHFMYKIWIYTVWHLEIWSGMYKMNYMWLIIAQSWLVELWYTLKLNFFMGHFCTIWCADFLITELNDSFAVKTTADETSGKCVIIAKVNITLNLRKRYIDIYRYIDISRVYSLPFPVLILMFTIYHYLANIDDMPICKCNNI